MAVSEKDLRLIRKGFENKIEKDIDKIRIGNHFVTLSHEVCKLKS